MLGIDCIRIVGDAGTIESKGGHAWNKVLFDKDPTDDIPAKYYLADITWTELKSSDREEVLSHTYFGLSDEQVRGTVRFSFDTNITKDDIDYTVRVLYEEIEKLRKASPLKQKKKEN